MGFDFAFWPMSKLGLERAQNRVPRRPPCCSPRARCNALVAFMQAAARPPPLPRAAWLCALLEWMLSCSDAPAPPSHSPSPSSLCVGERTPSMPTIAMAALGAPPFPQLRATTAAAMSLTIFASSYSTPRVRSLRASAAGGPAPPERPPMSCCSTWPHLLGPPRDEPWTPTGARRPPLAPHPLPHRRRCSYRPEWRSPDDPLLKFSSGASCSNLTKGRGPDAKPRLI
jgi:hypothetical protein